MSFLRNEIRILISGPENRFFVAYKPQGWFLTTPFDRTLGEGVMAPALAAKLGLPVSSLTFPSKLAAQERGLVIGCTDEAMHTKMLRMLQAGLCTKSYQCLIHANSLRKGNVRPAPLIKHSYGCFNHRKDVSSAVVTLDVKEHDKRRIHRSLQGVTDRDLRSGLQQFVAQSRSVYVSNVSLGRIINHEDDCIDTEDGRTKGDIDPGSTVSCYTEDGVISHGLGTARRYHQGLKGLGSLKKEGEHRIAFIMENLRQYLQRSPATGDSVICSKRESNVSSIQSVLSQYRHMELVTSSHMVNRHLTEVLSSLGLVLVTRNMKAGIKNNNITTSSLCLELCGMQFPHPIYSDRVIEVKVHENSPEVPEDWIKHAISAYSVIP